MFLLEDIAVTTTQRIDVMYLLSFENVRRKLCIGVPANEMIRGININFVDHFEEQQFFRRHHRWGTRIASGTQFT